LDDFGLDVFEVLVIQGKAAFEGAIGKPLFLLEQLQDLGQELVKVHQPPSTCLRRRRCWRRRPRIWSKTS
jgi:hypothetical protein